MVMVNASIAYARMGESDKAEKSLHKAIEAAPETAAAHFDMKLLKAEGNDPKQTEKYLKAALKDDPQMTQAAYNLCILLVRDRPEEAVGFCREASRLRPDDPKYACTLAFTLLQRGETAEAITALKTIVEKHPGYQEAAVLLREISVTRQKP